MILDSICWTQLLPIIGFFIWVPIVVSSSDPNAQEWNHSPPLEQNKKVAQELVWLVGKFVPHTIDQSSVFEVKLEESNLLWILQSQRRWLAFDQTEKKISWSASNL